MYYKFKKDPDAVLDYLFDFAASSNGRGLEDYLQLGEILSPVPGDVTVFVAKGSVVVDSFDLTDGNTSVTVWLSGGVLDETCIVTCRITTNMGRKDDRSIQVQITER